jgi:radical SAM protein with 4Fe4S-binding SPASM domain
MLKEIFKLGRQKVWLKHRDFLIEEHKLKYVFWECTLNCNFLCKHCWSNAWEKIIEETLTTKEIKDAFLDISKNFDSKEITIAVTGWEPLLRKDLFEVMKYARSLGFHRWMVTNWFFITQKVIEKMKDSWMETIDISIDWLYEIHDNFRNMKWSFSRNINAISLLKKENFLNPLRITTAVHKENIDNLQEIHDKFVEIWIKDRRINMMDPIWRWEITNKDLLLTKKQQKILFNFIKEKRKTSKINIRTSCAHFLWDEFEDEVRNHFFYCGTWINIWTILQNWDIFVCPNVPREKGLIQWNIKTDSFSEIWNKKFDFFRKKNKLENEKCLWCKYWEECLWWSVHNFDFKNKKPKMCFLDKKHNW